MRILTIVPLLLGGALALLGCGPKGKVIEVSSTVGASGYDVECRRLASQQRLDTLQGRYRPRAVTVRDWRGHTVTELREAELVDALAKGEMKRAVLYARAGLGKSRLATALRGQLCDGLPVWEVAAQEVARTGGAGNPIVNLLRARKGADFDGKTRKPGIFALVMLDALDEVEPSARARVTAALDDLIERVPGTAFLLLARPGVLAKDYGLRDLDAHLTMQPLRCAEVESFVTERVPKADDRTLFTAFLHRYGLDTRAGAGEACHYPHLQTFGDVIALAEFHRKALQRDAGVLISRSHVHEALVGARLGKELADLHWNAERALRLIDAMVHRRLDGKASRDLPLDMDLCEAAFASTGAGGLGVQNFPERVCERIFQSALFEPRTGGGFRLAGAGLVDLFLGRWLDQQIDPKALDCKAVLKHASVLQGRDVFVFLLGQPQGMRCIMPLLDDRCGREPKSDQIEALDDGLPTGRAREALVEQMKAGYEATHWKMCTRKSMRSFAETIGSL